MKSCLCSGRRLAKAKTTKKKQYYYLSIPKAPPSMLASDLNMCPRNKQTIFSVEPTQTEAQSVSVVFRVVSRNPKNIFSICFIVSDLFRNNRTNKTTSKQTEKIEKIKNMHPIHLRSATQGQTRSGAAQKLLCLFYLPLDVSVQIC
jgi:hypothetical protein